VLYNPEWEVKSDPFTLESLIAWLEKQPTNGTYNYSDCDGACLIDLYLGRRTSGTEYSSICDRTGWGMLAARFPRTFGAALERARKVQS
jgi:hypothetical protein